MRNKFTLILAGLLVLVGVALWIVLGLWSDSKTESKNNAALVNQNRIAYEQQISQRDSSIQNLAVQVSNLNSVVATEKGRVERYYALSTALQLQIQSLTSSGAGLSSTGEDSLGKFSRVDFKSKKGIAAISGFTKFYTSTLSTWSVDAEFNPIEVSSSLYREKSTGLWKILTKAHTPGILLRTSSDIDSSIYISLRTEEDAKRESNLFPSFGLRLKGNIAILTTDLQQKNLKGIGVDASAEVYYKYYNITYYPLTGVVSGGFVLNFDVGRLLNNIF